jgi:Ca-activated chloride channel homolog
MKIADPLLIAVLAPLFVAWIAIVVWLQRRRRVSATTFASLAPFSLLRTPWSVRLLPWIPRLRFIAVGLLVLALARPIGQHGKKALTSDGLHILLAIDTSGSMQALDLDGEKSIEQRRSRLGVVRDVVAQFLDARASDAVGLVVFGSFAFTQAPLTLDHTLLAQLVRRLEIGMAGQSTALGDAIVTGVKRLKDDKAKSRIIVLLTDGRSTTGNVDPREAAKVAKAYGIKVYTIGAAGHGRAPVIVDGFFGKEVQYITDDLDEDTLTSIADTTDGKYYRAEDVHALASIYADIDKLEKSAIDQPDTREVDEKYPLFLAPALLLVVLELVLMTTRFRSIP